MKTKISLKRRRSDKNIKILGPVHREVNQPHEITEDIDVPCEVNVCKNENIHNMFIPEHIYLNEIIHQIQLQVALSTKFISMFDKYSESSTRKAILVEMKEIEETFIYWTEEKKKFVEKEIKPIIISSSKKNILTKHFTGIFKSLDLELCKMKSKREELSKCVSDDSSSHSPNAPEENLSESSQSVAANNEITPISIPFSFEDENQNYITDDCGPEKLLETNRLEENGDSIPNTAGINTYEGQMSGRTWEVPLVNVTCCPLCSQTVNNEDLSYHVAVSHMANKCSVCVGFFVEDVIKLINLHQQTHTKENWPKVKSNLVCTITARPDQYVLQNNAYDTLSMDDVYTCVVCDYESNSNFHLLKHYTNNHVLKQWRKHICKLCLSMFLNEDRLLKHLKCYHLLKKNKSPKKIACIICYKEYDDTMDYVRHLQNDHQNNSMFKKALIGEESGLARNRCLYCDLFFKNKKTLAIHTIVKHGKPPYVCSCSTKFFSKGLFDWHLLNSTNCEISSKENKALERVKVYPFYE